MSKESKEKSKMKNREYHPSLPISRQDHPTRPDDLVRRDDIIGTGGMPQELEEMISNNYRYFYTTGEKVPDLDLRSILAEPNVKAWRISLDADILEGLPGKTLDQTTTSDLNVKPGDTLSQQSYRPDWVTLSFDPREVYSGPDHFLRRRNGKAVIPDFVIDPEERKNYFPNTWPWFCAGRIDVFKFGSFVWGGAGALVGKNIVLTASHMVPWGSGPGNWAMKFTPGFFDGQSTLGAGVFSWTERAHGYSDHDQGDDMAVLKLYTPLGNSVGFFGYKTYNDDWEDYPYWTLIGYPGAIGGGQRPARQFGIVIVDDDSGGAGVELEHTGDTTKGNSGGPLWAWWGDSPRVIGTHSGSEYNWDETNNVAAGGPALSNLIKWARDNW
jgi:V8-like Glu-specific endopeptidase